MGIFVGLVSVLAAAGLFWGSWQVSRLGIDLVRQARTALRGTQRVKATCVASGISRHTYRFVTPDGTSHVVYVPRTSEQDRRKTGSHAQLRYRTDDPRNASFAVVDMVIMPLGAVMWFFLATFCAASAALLLVFGYAAIF
ncbi:hypothetical protein ACIG0D_34160 [Streptomyces sp. NPDC052773]|uniref:hypothetical protein n=1 Tax=Streptomyces sp. NPDC052773 TaxID=3365693 RepID=UPI0037D4B232